jgi:hypothetical protein
MEIGETRLWLRVITRRVIASFLETLARSHGWHRLFLVSPWISDFGLDAGMTFTQLLKRLVDDNGTAYVVTRPPEEGWHDTALKGLAATGKANIALVPELHTKLYCAETDEGSFALMGSANLTEQSLTNLEIGVLIRAAGDGKALVKRLTYEASEAYRAPNRTLICQRRF